MLEVRPENCVAILKYKLEAFTTVSADTPLIDEDPIFVQFYLGKDFINGRTRLMTKLPDFLADISIDDMIGDIPERGEILRKLTESEDLNEEETEILNDIISEPLINYIPKRQNTEEERKLYLEQVFKEYRNVTENAQFMHQLSEAIVDNYRKRLKKRHFFGRRVMKYGLSSVEGNAFERAWKAILAREGEAQRIPTPEEPATPENEDLIHQEQPGPSGIQSRKNDGKSIREQLQDLEIGKENRTDISRRNGPPGARKSSAIRRLDLRDKTSSGPNLPSESTSNPSGAAQVSRKRQHEENKENRLFEEVGKVNVCVYDHLLQPKGILQYPVNLGFQDIIETIIDCYQLKTRSYLIGIHQVQHGEVREITEFTFNPDSVLYAQVYTGQTQIPCKNELSEIPEPLKPMDLQFIFDKTTNPSRIAEKLKNGEEYTEDELFQISALIGELVHNQIVSRRSTISERKLIFDHLLQGYAERNGVGNEEVAKFKSQIEETRPDGEFKEESPLEFMDRIYFLSDTARKELIKKLDLGYRYGEFQAEKPTKRRAEENRVLVNEAVQTEPIQPAVEQVTQALDNIEMDEVTPERAAELLCGLFGTGPVGGSSANVGDKNLQRFKDEVIVALLDENFALIDVEHRSVEVPVYTQMERMLLKNRVQNYHLLAIEKLEGPKDLKKIKSTSECLYAPCVFQVHTRPWDLVTDELIKQVPSQLTDKSIDDLLNSRQIDRKAKERILKAFGKKDGQLSEDDQRVIAKWCCETWMPVFSRVPQSAERELMFTHFLRPYPEFDAARLFRLTADALASGSRISFNSRQRRRLKILNQIINGKFEGKMRRLSGNQLGDAKPTDLTTNPENLEEMQMEISPVEPSMFNFLVPPMQGHNRILIYTEEKKFLNCICTQSPNTKEEIEQLVAKKMGIPIDHVLDVDCLRYADNFVDDTFYNTLVFVEVYTGEDPICTMEEDRVVPEVLRSVTFADVINSSGIRNYNGDRELSIEEYRRLAAKLAEHLGCYYKKRRPTKNEVDLFLMTVFQAKPEIAYELSRQREGSIYHRRALISVQLSIRQKSVRKKRLAYMTQYRDEEVANERLIEEAITNSEQPLNQQEVIENDSDDSDIVEITPAQREPNIQPNRPCTSRRSDGNLERNEVRAHITDQPSTSSTNASSGNVNASSRPGLRENLERLASTRRSVPSNPRPARKVPFQPGPQTLELQSVKDLFNKKLHDENRGSPNFYAVIGIDLSLIARFCMEHNIEEASRIAVHKVHEKFARPMPVVPRIQPRVVCTSQLESTRAENKHKIICIVLDIYGAYTHNESFSTRFEFTYKQQIREIAVNEWRRVVANGMAVVMTTSLRKVFFNQNFTLYPPNINPFPEPTSVDDEDDIQILDVVKSTPGQVGRKSVMAARANEARTEPRLLAAPTRRAENVRRTSDVSMLSEMVRRSTDPPNQAFAVRNTPVGSLPSSSKSSVGNQHQQGSPGVTPRTSGQSTPTSLAPVVQAYRPHLLASARRQADTQSNQFAPVGPPRQPQQAQYVQVGSQFVPIPQFRPNQYGYPYYRPQFMDPPPPYLPGNPSDYNSRIVMRPLVPGISQEDLVPPNVYMQHPAPAQIIRPMVPPQNLPTSTQVPAMVAQQQPQIQQPPRVYEPRVLTEGTLPDKLDGNDMNPPVLVNQNMAEQRAEDGQSDEDDIEFVEEVTKKYLSTNVMVVINENSELLCHCSINFSPDQDNLITAASGHFKIPRMDVLLVVMFAISKDYVCRFSSYSPIFVPSQMFLVGIKQNIEQIGLAELKEGDQLQDIYKKYDLAEMVDKIYPQIGQKLRSGETVKLTAIQAVQVSLEIARISFLHCAFRKFGDFEKVIFFNYLISKYPNLDTTIFSMRVYEALVPLEVAFKLVGNNRFMTRAKLVRKVFMDYLKSDPGPDAALLTQPITLPANVEAETKEVEEWLKKMEAEEARLECSEGNDRPDDGSDGGNQGRGDSDAAHERGEPRLGSNDILRLYGSDVDENVGPQDQGRGDGQIEGENEREDEEMAAETIETRPEGDAGEDVSKDDSNIQGTTTSLFEDTGDITIVRVSLPSTKSEPSSQQIDSQAPPKPCSPSRFPKEADLHGRGAYDKTMQTLYGKFGIREPQDEEGSPGESGEKGKTNDGNDERGRSAGEIEENERPEEPSSSRSRSLVSSASFDRMVQRCGVGRHVKRMENIYKDWREDEDAEETDQGEDSGQKKTEKDGRESQEDGTTTPMSMGSLGDLQIEEREGGNVISEKNIDDQVAMEFEEAQAQPGNDEVPDQVSKHTETDDEICEAYQVDSQDLGSSRKSSDASEILLHRAEEQIELDLLQAADELAESDGLEDLVIDESILDSQEDEDRVESQNDERIIEQEAAGPVEKEEDRILEENSLDGELVIDEETLEMMKNTREMEKRDKEKRETEGEEIERKVEEHGQGEGQRIEKDGNKERGEEDKHAVVPQDEASLNARQSVSGSGTTSDSPTAAPSNPPVTKTLMNKDDYIVISDDEAGPSNSTAPIPEDLVEIDSIGPDDQPNTLRVYVINENHRLRAKVNVQIDPGTATVKSVVQKVAEEIKIDPAKVKIVEKIAHNEQVVEASSWSKILVTERPYIMTIYQNEPADSSGFTRLPLGLKRYKWQDILDKCPSAPKIMDKVNLVKPFSDAEKRELSRAIVIPMIRYLIGRTPNRGEINAFIQHLNLPRHGFLTRELFAKVSRCSSIDYLTDAKDIVSKEFKVTRIEAIKKIIALQKWASEKN